MELTPPKTAREVRYVFSDRSKLTIDGETYSIAVIRPRWMIPFGRNASGRSEYVTDRVRPEEYDLAEYVWERGTEFYMNLRREAEVEAVRRRGAIPSHSGLLSTIQKGIDFSWGRSGLIVIAKGNSLSEIVGSLGISWRDPSIGLPRLPMEMQFPQWKMELPVPADGDYFYSNSIIDPSDPGPQVVRKTMGADPEIKFLGLKAGSDRNLLFVLFLAMEKSLLSHRPVWIPHPILGDQAMQPVYPAQYRAFGDEASSLLFKRMGFDFVPGHPEIQGESSMVVSRKDFAQRVARVVSSRVVANPFKISDWTHDDELLGDVRKTGRKIGYTGHYPSVQSMPNLAALSQVLPGHCGLFLLPEGILVRQVYDLEATGLVFLRELPMPRIR